MERIKLYQVDAFTDKLFHGNPAAVCILSSWLNDELMLAIALEKNLSETAFVVERPDGYDIRWFNLNGEIDLCGHATLAAAYILFANNPSMSELTFSSISGSLNVRKKGLFIQLDFPMLTYESVDNSMLSEFVNQPIVATYRSPKDWLLILEHSKAIKQAEVDFQRIKSHPMRGLIISSASDDVDIYSRCFFPKQNIDEDPVTGSAYCLLAPVWAERLGKQSFMARQGSNRQGMLYCQIHGKRVWIQGECRQFLEGYIDI